MGLLLAWHNVAAMYTSVCARDHLWLPPLHHGDAGADVGLAVVEENGADGGVTLAWKGLSGDPRVFARGCALGSYPQWSAQSQVGGDAVKTSWGPSMAYDPDRPAGYFAWPGDRFGAKDTHLYVAANNEFQPQFIDVVPGVDTFVAPGMTVYRDVTRQPKVYLAWPDHTSHTICWTRGDMGAWEPVRRLTDRSTKQTVALCPHNGALYMAWRGLDPHDKLYWSASDGHGWSPPQVIPGFASLNGPALASDDHLYMAFQGQNLDSSVYWSMSDGGSWSPKMAVPDATTTHAPALCSFGTV